MKMGNNHTAHDCLLLSESARNMIALSSNKTRPFKNVLHTFLNRKLIGQ